MKTTLTLATLALAGLLLSTPTSTQAGPLKLDALHQGSLLQTASMTKKVKKKVMRKKRHKKHAMMHKKKVMKHAKIKKRKK